MRYELTNKIYGHKRIAPSEACKDNFLASCKRLKDGTGEWYVSKELEDEIPKPKYSMEELEAMMAELKEQEGVEMGSTGLKPEVNAQDAGSIPASSTNLNDSTAPPKKKAGRPKK